MALYGFEHSMPDANGHISYMSTVISPFRDIKSNIIGLVGVSIDISHIKSALVRNSELLAQNRELTRSLFTVQEEERKHLARELHDELGQWLTAIQAEAHVICNIANSHAPKIYDSALAISNSAKEVHGVIRGMLRKLRPSMLDELGLADSLRELHFQWCSNHPDVVCEIKLNVPLDELGEEINVTIYRLVQESLSNIANHARALRVVVSFRRETDSASGTEFLSLQVEDDGRGFDVKQTPSGIGLLGMRERVIATGGEFYIDSMPGSGTKITARMPLKKCEMEKT
jgi:glucose-6-phosphate-specific signal transduction histidine kinase